MKTVAILGVILATTLTACRRESDTDTNKVLAATNIGLAKYPYRHISTQVNGKLYFLGPNGVKFDDTWSKTEDKVIFTRCVYVAVEEFLQDLANWGKSPLDPHLTTNIVTFRSRDPSNKGEDFTFVIDGRYLVVVTWIHERSNKVVRFQELDL
jgi:hypothetical protein